MPFEIPSSKEQGLPRFETLSSPKKVEAILATVKEPVGRKFAMELAGIDEASLSEKDKEVIETVFKNSEVAKGMFMLNGEERKRVEGETDPQSANKRIADVLWASLDDF